ncbi:hypothetical protein [Desulforhopalus sp. IMCC35007]|uniref:hypothetical protein n=1 Tax=Desulforhopalus sp. IMCC35007 TaxID=2569543 RepID=UPI0010ADE87C|nr:hypothetical protein [Desulforhopalus sp. IMCC35007]TKB05530.1 hypothetical protein FCL48_24535 [Desulforhopalus sp. IMCC35007]
MKIISVAKVEGSHVYYGWRDLMQIIETSKGTFTDNTVGSTYWTHKPGYDWASLVGSEINEGKIKILGRSREGQKYDWIKWYG